MNFTVENWQFKLSVIVPIFNDCKNELIK